MKYETTLIYTVPIVREAVFGFWRRSVGVGFLIALVILAVVLAFDVSSGDRSWRVGMLGAVLLIGAGMMVAIYFVHYANATRKLKEMGEPRAAFTASESSFTVASGAGSSTLPWSSVTEVWKLRGCWLLLFSKAQFITLPILCVPEEMRAFILQRVAAAGGKVNG
jgi:hypothetical protein